ncbi:acyltransferase family protein [Stenotrophomonas humi]
MLAKFFSVNPVAVSAGSGYRPDIDGLRAIAVLSVIVYHINRSFMPGGFVGVDIFFVISGFLITGNIWSEMSKGKFSLLNFYVRRIHRIYPAFAVVTMVTLLIGSFLLLSSDLVRLARSAFWAALSIPNVYFWKYLDTSYFAAAAEQEPLLHMWSLGVEEQFYFIWPATLLVLCAATKRNKLLIVTLAILAGLASFAYAQTFLSAAPKFTYYMLPARAGELLLGAVTALLLPGKVTGCDGLNRWVTEMCSIAGVALIGCSLIFLNHFSEFPGVNSIWPCLGAVLLIVAGQRGAWFSRSVLSLQPVVYIGLISYSLYLWHWPVLAFIRYFYGEVSIGTGIFSVFFMLMAAWLSYRYVEIPFRHWRPGWKRSVGLVWVLPLLLIGGSSLALLSTNGLQNIIEDGRGYKERSAELQKSVAPAYSYKYVCQTSSADADVLRDPRCIVGDVAAGKPRVLIWGDSKAAQYVGLFDELGKQSGVSIRNAEHSSCPPVFADGYGVGRYRESCDKFWRVIHSGVMQRDYDTIVISGSWGYYAGLAGFSKVFENTIHELRAAGARVVFVTDVPVYRGYNRECLKRSMRLPWKINCGANETSMRGDLSPFEVYLSDMVRKDTENFHFLNSKELLCPGGICSGTRMGVPLYFDEGHVSLEGGRLLARDALDSSEGSSWLSILQHDVVEKK